MGRVIAVCTSTLKGTQKQNRQEGKLIENFGLEEDAHAGNWHRQVSLLSYEKILAFNEKGAKVQDGDFGENLIVEGIDFRELPVGTMLHCNEIVLQMTQIGKECHNHCQIFQKMGDCIMPREGVFARVIKGGIIKAGYEMIVSEISEGE